MKKFKIIQVTWHPPLRLSTPTYTDISFILGAKKSPNLLYDHQVESLQEQCKGGLTSKKDDIQDLDKVELGIGDDTLIIEMSEDNSTSTMLKFYKIEYRDNIERYIVHNINGNCFTQDDWNLLSVTYKWLLESPQFAGDQDLKIVMEFFAQEENRALSAPEAEQRLREYLKQKLTPDEKLKEFLTKYDITFCVKISLAIHKNYTLEQFLESNPLKTLDSKAITPPSVNPTPTSAVVSTPTTLDGDGKKLSSLTTRISRFFTRITSNNAPAVSNKNEHVCLSPDQIELYIATNQELAIAFVNQAERDNFLKDLNLSREILILGGIDEKTGIDRRNMLYLKNQKSATSLTLTFQTEEQKTKFCAKFHSANHLFDEDKNNTVTIDLTKIPSRHTKQENPLICTLAEPCTIEQSPATSLEGQASRLNPSRPNP